MERRYAIGMGMLLLALFAAAPAFADENEVMMLKKEVSQLNDKVAELERHLQVMKTAGSEKMPTYVAPTEPEGGFLHSVEDIHIGGFVDTAWHWNFNNPTNIGPNQATATTGTREQSIRVFDQDEGSYTLHAVELYFEKLAPKTGGVGFRTDLYYGEDAEVITPTGSVVDEFDIEQAYVEANFPIHALEGNEIFGDSVNIRAGKFVTLAGAEVIEAKDNWNTTRGLLFGWAIPFTHTGVRSSYGFLGDKVGLTLGMNNGWDIVEDNNDYQTFEGQIAYKPLDNVSFYLNTYMGPENPKTDAHKRYLLDLVGIWNVTDKLSLMANIDYGSERRVAANATEPFENAQWHGYALYARYQTTEKLAFATRWEIFVDDDSFRVGNGGLAPIEDFSTGALVNNFPLDDRTYWEWTYTTEYKLYNNLISRLEYRHDWSDGRIFNGESSQDTLSAQLIYNFA